MVCFVCSNWQRTSYLRTFVSPKNILAIFPQWEYYRRDKNEIWIKGLFPEDVFTKTTYSLTDF